MVAPILPTQERGEPEIRLRRGFFGKLIVQVRYPLFRATYPFPTRDRIDHWEGRGVGRWRDADPDNFREVLAIIDRLKISAV
jgi:hypothetical protein